MPPGNMSVYSGSNSTDIPVEVMTGQIIVLQYEKPYRISENWQKNYRM